MGSRFGELSRAELAVLVPELLLCGHLIDRSGMPWALQKFGHAGMVQVAVDEWMAASPIYVRRMQRALGFEGSDVTTIFKSMQFDIGAPPQFMDFRYRVDSPTEGEFWLDHCGALLDVEPMGERFVVGMCHDIEDPTFDATAAATNPKAQVRPVHRPPRHPADRHPHCLWRVSIDESHPDVQPSPLLSITSATAVASLELDAIDLVDEGRADYRGPLLSDLDFAAFSRSALRRIADEVCIQQHLLNLGYLLSIANRLGDDEKHLALSIGTKQLTGIAGLTAERIHRALKLEPTPEGAVRMLAVHPAFNPAAYVDATFDGATVSVRRSAAHEDGAWVSMCGPGSPAPLQAMVRAVDPHLDVELSGWDDEWQATVVVVADAAPEAPEVQLTRFSGGAAFAFQPRASIPLTVPSPAAPREVTRPAS
jgi:hypothetical protein